MATLRYLRAPSFMFLLRYNVVRIISTTTAL
jgi:hypothetical protein